MKLRYNKYFPIACIYFFINTPAFFPPGLSMTSILAPGLYIWLLLKKRRFVLELYLLALFPFFFANLLNGIIWTDFAITSTLLLTVYVAAYAIAVAIQEMNSLEQLMQTLIKLNFILALVGLVVRFSPAEAAMWQTYFQTSGYNFVRYNAFSYEPAQFSLLIAPVVLYSYWRMMYRRSRANIGLFIMAAIPLLMALSFGALGSISIAVIVVHLFFGRGFYRVMWIVAIAVAILTAFIVLPASSSIKLRMEAVATGNDSSENSRTKLAYLAAYEMAAHKNLLFGVGLGEGKEFNQFTEKTQAGRMPSAVAGTLGEMGIVGVLVRFALEIFFFIRTKPYRDPYRFSLFLTMFVLQFGASYDVNIVEYVMWILAFSRSVSFFSVPVEVREKPAPFQLATQMS